MDYNLIVPYIPNLRRYARALVGDRDGADDLVQDTLERAVRKFHLWRPGDLRAWLVSIMHNVLVNQRKAKPIALRAGSAPRARPHGSCWAWRSGSRFPTSIRRNRRRPPP